MRAGLLLEADLRELSQRARRLVLCFLSEGMGLARYVCVFELQSSVLLATRHVASKAFTLSTMRAVSPTPDHARGI